jgi:ubiquinone biosynthesis protein COQ9
MKKKSRKSPASKPKTASRDRLLNAVLAQAPFEGWTEASYVAALKDVGVTRAEADKMFPHGLRDVVDLFGDQTDAAMQKRIAAHHGFPRLRVRDKITFGVRARLESLSPHREAMRRLMLWYALPHHVPIALKRMMKTVDLIWVAAGDASTDYNFYTKRILLAGVIKATVIFWLGDESDDHAATWKFLDQRIGDVMKLGKGISLLKEFKPSELVDMVRDKIKKAI